MLTRTLLALLTTVFALQLSAQTSLTIRDPQVEMKFKETPLFKFTNEANINKSQYKWLAIQLAFTAVEKKASKNKYYWTNNIIVQFELLIPSSDRNRNVVALMSGEVTYWAIPMDGKKHILDGYIPPQVLRRYLRAGFKLNKSLIKSMFDVRITLMSKDRRILSRFYYPRKDASEKEIERRFARATDTVAGGVIYIKDSIYPRDKTPWQFINFSSQDLMKIDNSRSRY